MKVSSYLDAMIEVKLIMRSFIVLVSSLKPNKHSYLFVNLYLSTIKADSWGLM